MQDLLSQLSTNPLFSLVLILVTFLLIFLILRSLLKVVLFTIAVFALYLGYHYFLQDKFPIPAIQIQPETINELSEKIGDLIPENFDLSLLDSNHTRPSSND